MKNVKYITIRGYDFVIVDEIDYNYNHYLLAIDEAGEDTIAVLRQSIVDGNEVVESVLDQKELEEVLEVFNNGNN